MKTSDWVSAKDPWRMLKREQAIYHLWKQLINRWNENKGPEVDEKVNQQLDKFRKLWAQTAHTAVLYARHRELHRFPEGEPEILKDPHACYDYITKVLGGRWPEGEKAILKSGNDILINNLKKWLNIVKFYS